MKLNRPLFFLLLFVPILLGGLDSTLFNSVAYEMPVLSDTTRLWFIDSYSIALAACVVLGSRLGARIGPGLTMTIGLIVFSMSSAVPALFDNSTVWVVLRFIQGFGYALIVSSVASVVGALPTTAQRTQGYTVWIATYSAGAGLGPLAGKYVISIHEYELLFWIPAAVGLCWSLLTFRYIRTLRLESAASDSVDVLSSILALAGFGLFVAGLQSHSQATIRIALTLTGCAILWVFSRRQLNSSDPLIDVRMLSFSRLGACSTALTVGSACYTGAIFVFSSQAGSILDVLPVSLLAIWVSLGSYIFSKAHSRIRSVPLMQASLLLCAVGLAAAPVVGLWPASIVIGTGVGVAMASGDAYLLGSVMPHETARAAALQETSLAVGAALGVAVFGGLFVSLASSTLTLIIGAAIVTVLASTLGLNRGVLTA